VERSKLWSQDVKPICQLEQRGFQRTDCFFQTHAGRWHGWGDGEPFRRCHNLGREYLIEAARERTKEMIVFAILLFAAAWPTVLVIIEVTRLYKNRH
jgi:hypothetical protein